MTNCRINPLVRIALRGAVPRELLWLLPLVNVNPFGAGGLDADLVAAFARDTRGGWSVSLRAGTAATTTDRGFFCDNAYMAATFLLSRGLGLRDPFLAASEDTFAILRQAVTLAPGAEHVMIEGEAGVGKRSLAILLHRASSRGELVRVDCAAPEEVARELATLASGRLEITGRPPRTVLLDRLAELPQPHQMALAREIAAHPHPVRYIATMKLPDADRVAPGPIAPALRDLFTATLRLASLTRRVADLTMLARHFLRHANPLLQLDGGAVGALRDYRFPGNVRELHSLMTRLEIYETSEQLRTIDSARVLRQLEAIPAPASEEAASMPSAGMRGRHNHPHLRLVRSVAAKARMATRSVLPHVTSR